MISFLALSTLADKVSGFFFSVLNKLPLPQFSTLLHSIMVSFTPMSSRFHIYINNDVESVLFLDFNAM